MYFVRMLVRGMRFAGMRAFFARDFFLRNFFLSNFAWRHLQHILRRVLFRHRLFNRRRQRRSLPRLSRRHPQKTRVKPNRKQSLLLLVRQIDQIAKILQQRLGLHIRPFRLLHCKLMLPVAEPHDLHVSAGAFARRPVRPYLLVNFKVVAPQPKQRLAKSPQDSGMFHPPVSGDNVTVGLQKHRRDILVWGRRSKCRWHPHCATRMRSRQTHVKRGNACRPVE